MPDAAEPGHARRHLHPGLAAEIRAAGPSSISTRASISPMGSVSSPTTSLARSAM
jgi:hypothetical protein